MDGKIRVRPVPDLVRWGVKGMEYRLFDQLFTNQAHTAHRKLGIRNKKLRKSKLRFRRETFVEWAEEAMKHGCADKQAQATDSK